MITRRRRSRLSRVLLDSACERFYACDVCDKEAPIFIEEALAPLRLKQRELKRLLRHLTCPSCESPVRAGTFVVTPTTEQFRQARLSRKFDVLYSAQLKNFREFLINYPMLGAEHPFGRLLSKAMARAQTTVLEPSVWYRARKYARKPKFGPRPPVESTTAGRYNQIGQAAWYLGSDEKTVAVEVIREPEAKEKVCLAQIRLKEAIAVLDLRSVIWGEDPIRQWILRNVVDSRFISEPTGDIEDTRPEYRIPQFIADLARKRKFRGILYDSTRPSPHNNPEAVGHNLVVFDPMPSHCVGNQAVVKFGRFGNSDDDPFCPERWPLQAVSDRCGDE
jgi:RES domain